MENKTLIYGSMSFAGMGPYVSEIVNTFLPTDNVVYMLFDVENRFFAKNVKQELKNRCVFINYHHGVVSKADFLLGIYKRKKRNALLKYCVNNNINCVHFINGCTDNVLINKLNIIGVRTLITVHDLHPHEDGKVFWKRWKYHSLAKQEMRTINGCPNLVTNSRIQYEELKRIFPHKNVSFHEFPSLVSKEVREGKDIPPELLRVKNKYILFFGRIEKYKGIDILYNAYSKSKELQKNFMLVIAGKGRLVNLQENIEPNVLFINRYIKDSEVGYLYKNASAVVYPYISATQSGVLSLSCYFQVPSVVSDIPYFTFVVAQSKIATTFKVCDENDLVKQLKILLEKPEPQMRNNQQQFYAKFYSNSSIRVSLLEIYKNMKLCQ